MISELLGQLITPSLTSKHAIIRTSYLKRRPLEKLLKIWTNVDYVYLIMLLTLTSNKCIFNLAKSREVRSKVLLQKLFLYSFILALCCFIVQHGKAVSNASFTFISSSVKQRKFANNTTKDTLTMKRSNQELPRWLSTLLLQNLRV